MKSRLLAAFRRSFNLHRPGRNLGVFPDDTFLLSYPKSGNTWSRFLVANLLRPGQEVDFSNINGIIPDTEGTTKRYLNALPRPRVLKSHQYFDPRYPKVVFIVRDPRDVVLSEYYWDIKRRAVNDDCSIENFVQRFVHGPVNHPFGTWGDNVASWFYTRRHNPSFLLVKYESLQADPRHEVTRIARFLNLPAGADRIDFAIRQSSADRMRELERKQGHLWASTKDTRKDKPFVRAAKSGGWRAELPEACIAQLEAVWGGLMRDLGYELTTTNNARSSGETALTMDERR
jgi:sulfotransferase family protein